MAAPDGQVVENELLAPLTAGYSRDLQISTELEHLLVFKYTRVIPRTLVLAFRYQYHIRVVVRGGQSG